MNGSNLMKVSTNYILAYDFWELTGTKKTEVGIQMKYLKNYHSMIVSSCVFGQTWIKY